MLTNEEFLVELISSYYELTDRFDNLNCSGPSVSGVKWPATHKEFIKSNSYAYGLGVAIKRKADELGFTVTDLEKAHKIYDRQRKK